MRKLTHKGINFEYEANQKKENVCVLYLNCDGKAINTFFERNEDRALKKAIDWLDEMLVIKKQSNPLKDRRYNDKHNNSMIFDTKGGVYLRLDGDQKDRKIGIIDRANRLIRMERKVEKHLFLQNHSYGFNYHLLKYNNSFDTIRLTDDNGLYYIPKSVVLTRGDFKRFNKQGFELQLFLELDIIEKYKSNK